MHLPAAGDELRYAGRSDIRQERAPTETAPAEDAAIEGVFITLEGAKAFTSFLTKVARKVQKRQVSEAGLEDTPERARR